jgi:hypothetical protein
MRGGTFCDVRCELRFAVRCAAAGTPDATTIDMATAVIPKRDFVILDLLLPILGKAIVLPPICKALSAQAGVLYCVNSRIFNYFRVSQRIHGLGLSNNLLDRRVIHCAA